MNHHPLLLFPAPAPTDPSPRPSGRGFTNQPSVARQAERLSSKFSRLESVLERRQVEIQNDTPGIDPEYTVVIETYGSVSEFFKAVKKIEGLEWLGEYELRELTPDEDFYDKKNRDKTLNGQVMLVLSDRRAIDELLSLWRSYGQDPKMNFMRGWAKFRDLFRLLKDIRYWDSQDRLKNTGILEYWKERLEDEPDIPVRFEAELWFRANETKRNLALANVSNLTKALGGQVISTCCFPDINYQSLLLELPAEQVNQIIEQREVSLVRCDQVMLFRPLGQMSVEPLWNTDGPSISEIESDTDSAAPVELKSTPRIALFDGLPLANHTDLQDSLIIDDPDNFQAGYLAEYRVHGTAMASLIINGDLTESGGKLTTPLYVRPIMKPDPLTINNTETLPDDELPLDIIHRAVKRLFEGDGTESPVAPTIKVINLSIGDPNIHFSGKMSPFARLLDWLSSKYNVLFIVSSGNHSDDVTVPIPGGDFDKLPNDGKSEVFFNAVQSDGWNRKLLSPAESINSITVGALHSDSSSFTPHRGLYDIYRDEMPAAYSGQGNGYLRSVKPDIAMPGGRMLYREAIGHSNLNAVSNYAAPGQLVAHPHSSAFNYRVYTRGTSNSAALISRGCAEICEVLEDLFSESGKLGDFEQYSALLLKALIAHCASWGQLYDHIATYIQEKDANSIKKAITQKIGYGKPDLDRAKFCLDNRATILGYGELGNDEAHIYQVPIPEGLGAADIWRRLTVTLAWFAKPCSTNMKYKDSALWFTMEGDNKGLASRSQQSVNWQQVRRGTLQHEIFEGRELAVITKDRMLQIKVNCKENASKILEPIRYGLAITLEVAEDIDMQLYQELEVIIRDQIREQERSRTRTQVRTR